MSNDTTFPTSETDDILGYDANHNDDSQYCQHGTFIGSWWGPDYLCGWCEDGISVEEMHEIQAAQEKRRVIDAIAKLEKLGEWLRPYPQLLTWYVTYVEQQAYEQRLV